MELKLSKTPPNKSPAKKTKSTTPAKPTKTKYTPKTKSQPEKVVDVLVGVGEVCGGVDDSFFSDLLSGSGSVLELREQFDAELERQKLEALAEFAAGAGHEINNPLAIISGRAQLLLREIENTEHQRQLSVIIAQVKRAYEMIADIRYFARPPKPFMTQFDVVEELRKIVSEQMSKIVESNFEIRLETEIESLIVNTDKVQLHIVIAALCNNARESIAAKYIDQNHDDKLPQNASVDQTTKGQIIIRLSQIANENEFEISVLDNGIGISSDVRRLIFCPYFSGRQAGRGLGFGLPKAWRIIQQLNGSIKPEPPPKNNKNNSTKFIIKLPIK
ncbi:MAG: HAMP domain-containing histidine kinase [Planctomycetaceae bacterium]|jgi:signal transduction histidine kinase|nr:HAMP domain-containing histidine kinase [Planctomycetaceae bacterium]